jgi:hypothetical protein
MNKKRKVKEYCHTLLTSRSHSLNNTREVEVRWGPEFKLNKWD